MRDGSDQVFFFELLDPEAENAVQRDKLRLEDGERREVAILFADVKNCTQISSSMDAEMFKRLLEPLMKRFDACINHFGGYRDKFMGDGIMGLFGARQASEQDTERAVMTALKMLDQVQWYNRKLKAEQGKNAIEIGIRIGINTGEVVAGKYGSEEERDFTVMGTAVNLAQRLEGSAPVNRILLSLDAKRAVERFFECELHGSVHLKGIPGPVETWLVKCLKLDKGPRWQQRKSVFIGREAEMSQMVKAFRGIEEAMKNGIVEPVTPSVIGIVGDAGLGKTRLVHEFVSAHANRLVLISGAASGIVRSPLNIFVNLVESYFRLAPGDCVEARRAKLEDCILELGEGLDDAAKAELASALPLIGKLLEIPFEDPRLRLSGSELLNHLKLALRCVLERVLQKSVEAGKPVLLVLDDIHWMDDASAEMFRYLADKLILGPNAPLAGKVLLVLQYREGYCPDPVATASGAFIQIELKPLLDNEISRLVRSYVEGYSIPDEVLAKVQKLSMGNPFYLEEWCNYLGDLSKYDLKDLPIPASLHALVLSRLDMLDASIRLLLQKAAVIGQEFFVDILSWIEDKLYNPIDVSGTLSHLEQQSFILKLLGFDYSAYFFKHITTRDVAYNTLLWKNRSILHRLAAEAIEALYPDRRHEFLFTLADHYHRAGMAETVDAATRAEIAEKAAYYLENAALAAEKVYANSDAIAHWEKLLSWLQYLPAEYELSEARVLLNMVELRSLTGHWDAADTDLRQAFASASESGNSKDLFDCHRLSGNLAFRHGNMEGALDAWTQASNLAQSHTQIAIAQCNLGIWHQHHKQWDEALRYHQASLEAAEKAQDPLRAAKTLSNLGFMYLDQKDFTASERHLRDCLDICEQHQYLQLKSIALGNLGFLRYKQGEIDAAMDYYQQKWLLVRKMDDQAELIKVLGNIANIHRDKGMHLEALDYYRQVLALKQRLGNRLELAKTHNAIAAELKELGDLDAALENILQAVSYAEDYPANLCNYLYHQAEILADLQRWDEAKGICARAMEIALSVPRPAVEKACRELMEGLGSDKA
jgi:class 3 adenylate cyclase/predicted ATPase